MKADPSSGVRCKAAALNKSSSFPEANILKLNVERTADENENMICSHLSSCLFFSNRFVFASQDMRRCMAELMRGIKAARQENDELWKGECLVACCLCIN